MNDVSRGHYIRLRTSLHTSLCVSVCLRASPRLAARLHASLRVSLCVAMRHCMRRCTACARPCFKPPSARAAAHAARCRAAARGGKHCAPQLPADGHANIDTAKAEKTAGAVYKPSDRSAKTQREAPSAAGATVAFGALCRPSGFMGAQFTRAIARPACAACRAPVPRRRADSQRACCAGATRPLHPPPHRCHSPASRPGACASGCPTPCAGCARFRGRARRIGRPQPRRRRARPPRPSQRPPAASQARPPRPPRSPPPARRGVGLS